MTIDAPGTPRDALRGELAGLLEIDPDLLADAAHLLGELAFDSLTMMRVQAWARAHGVTLDQPKTVGELLDAVVRGPGRPVAIQIVSDAIRSPAALPTPVRLTADPLAPVLETETMRLTPVLPDDTAFLYSLAAHSETSFRWRFRGAPPSIDRFHEQLWKQVLVQFVARRIDTGEPAGHVVAYGADPGMRFGYVGAVFIPEYTGAGEGAQAVAAFMRYLFHTFPFHKLYMEIPGFNWPQVRSGEGHLFQVEGVLRDHNYYAGRLWDEYVCAVYADTLKPAPDRGVPPTSLG